MADTEGKIEAAQRVAQSGIMELVQVREVRIINKLVSAYRSGELTDREAAIGIASIAELRSLYSESERTVNRGVVAGEALTKAT